MSSQIRMPSFQQDETLVSWLVRGALMHGADAMVLGHAIMGKYRLWTLDFERAMPADKIMLLAKRTGQEKEVLADRLHEKRVRLMSPDFNPASGVWPWLLPLGHRNRQQSLGYRYCPVCFANAPYLRWEWRMAWATACRTHEVALRDKCPECGYLYRPDKLPALTPNLAFCHHCKASLANQGVIHLDSPFQTQAYTHLVDEKDPSQWFEWARAWLGIVRFSARQPESRLSEYLSRLGVDLKNARAGTGLIFECLTARERARLLECVQQIMSAKPKTWLNTALETGLSANQLCNAFSKASIPPFIQELATSLPRKDRIRKAQQENPSTILSEAQVMRKWARLERKIKRITIS